jgi:hypothetical protein
MVNTQAKIYGCESDQNNVDLLFLHHFKFLPKGNTVNQKI